MLVDGFARERRHADIADVLTRMNAIERQISCGEMIRGLIDALIDQHRPVDQILLSSGVS